MLTQANRLEEQAQKKMSEGHLIAAVGGFLAPFTLGASLVAGVYAGDQAIRTGDQMLYEFQMLQTEAMAAFSSFDKMLTSSVSAVEFLSSMLVSLETDIRALSNSTNTPAQLRKARSKASRVCRAVAKYISLTEVRHGGARFFPYLRNDTINCDGCDKHIDPDSLFYHCATCTASIDFCGSCYISHRHRSHEWTKHHKAQFLLHGYSICHGCYSVINTGTASYCGYCHYELCPRCDGRYFHHHRLYKANIRWYDNFLPEQSECDECQSNARKCGMMYQCLECFWYFVREQCKKQTGYRHPHGLLRFTVVQNEVLISVKLGVELRLSKCKIHE